jgi:hypothetical protein
VSWGHPRDLPPARSAGIPAMPQPCVVCHAKMEPGPFVLYRNDCEKAVREIRVRYNSQGRTHVAPLCAKHLRRLQTVVNEAVASLE